MIILYDNNKVTSDLILELPLNLLKLLNKYLGNNNKIGGNLTLEEGLNKINSQIFLIFLSEGISHNNKIIILLGILDNSNNNKIINGVISKISNSQILGDLDNNKIKDNNKILI